MRRTLTMLVWLAAAGCVDEGPPPLGVDECEPRPFTPGGRTEVGLGSEFAPIIDGQDVTLHEGYRRFLMLTVNARVTDMDVGDGDREGVVNFAAFQGEQQVSLEVGCRVREFEADGRGRMQLASNYNLTMHPDFTPILEGATLTLRLDVLDRHGRHATSERTVVSHLPPPP